MTWVISSRKVWTGGVVEGELRSQLRFMGAGEAEEHLSVVSGCWRLFSRRFGVKIPINLDSTKK